MQIHFADPEYEKNFQAYLNYLEDLAGLIGGTYGLEESLVQGVYDGMQAHLAPRGIQCRPLSPDQENALAGALRKAWGDLRRLHRELDEGWEYDEEANAWLPVQAYYAVHKGALALAVATGQQIPKDHAAALRLLGEQVKRGLFPYPWSSYCVGCPQTNGHIFGGLHPTGSSVHVLSRPDPASTEDRLAMFLRTTRARDLERRFADQRTKPRKGRSRRNLSRESKNHIGDRTSPTTVFNLFWRMRKKANYDDADVFVLGAVDAFHAGRFGSALAIVTNATVAAIEGVVAAYAGHAMLLHALEIYSSKARSDPGMVLARRIDSWQRVSSTAPVRSVV